MIPRLPAFTRRHPGLRIDLVLSDQRQDLVNEGIDVALRWGELTDSSATVRRRRLAASPRRLI